MLNVSSEHPFKEQEEKVFITVKVLRCLRFTMTPDKSILKPTRELTCLDLVINSKYMRLSDT